MNIDIEKNIVGYTLVEIMVALLLTFIILGGVFRTIGDETIDKENKEKILDMQNNARQALNRITRDIRRAGFLGCGDTLAKNNLINAHQPDDPLPDNLVGKLTIATDFPGLDAWDGSQSILAELMDRAADNATTNIDYLGEALGFYNDAVAGLYREGTDAISLVFLSDERAIGPMASGSVVIPLVSSGFNQAKEGFHQSDILYITDCEHYSLFQKTDTDLNASIKHEKADDAPVDVNPKLNNNIDGDDLGKSYGTPEKPARVYKLNIATYFIEHDTFSLNYNRAGNQNEIAANIEDLQVEFLFDEDLDKDLSDEVWRNVQTTGTGLTVAATGITYTSKDVRAVRVWVLAMSDVIYTYTDNNTYDYPNSPYYSAANPFGSARNAAGGSPASNPGYKDAEHRYRYLSSAVVYLRNAGL